MTKDDLAIGRLTGQFFSTPHAQANLDPKPALLALINGAKKSINFGVYSFTDPDLGQALITAHNRGVVVQGTGDFNEWAIQNSQYPTMLAAGLDLHRTGGPYQLMHLKCAVVDSKYIVTGSFNWTRQADTVNKENMFILSGSAVAVQEMLTEIAAAYAAGSTPTS